jgi:hypothetical protein
MVFIDEIDAVGMRRQALQGGYGFQPIGGTGFEQAPLYGPWGALTRTGDIIIESRDWRDRLFATRAETRPDMLPPALASARDNIARYMFPGMGGMGGQLALNQLLVQMDGVDEPPFFRKFVSNRVNTFLDATYFAWAATSGSGRPRRTTARTSSTSTSTRSTTIRSWIGPSAATSSPA